MCSRSKAAHLEGGCVSGVERSSPNHEISGSIPESDPLAPCSPGRHFSLSHKVRRHAVIISAAVNALSWKMWNVSQRVNTSRLQFAQWVSAVRHVSVTERCQTSAAYILMSEAFYYSPYLMITIANSWSCCAINQQKDSKWDFYPLQANCCNISSSPLCRSAANSLRLFRV